VDPEHAQELLARERERIERAVLDLRLGDPDDPGDEGSETLYQNEFDEGQVPDLERQRAALERAEARLAAGTYGFSVESGAPIPDERLELLPTAERTVEEERAQGGG
jgi:DnaK suppressor protein